MKIRVTQDHINRGEKNSPWKCPIALACNETFKLRDGYYLSVGSDRLWIDYIGGGNIIYALLPGDARVFISTFDNRFIAVPPSPFEFDIDPTGLPLEVN